MILTYFKNELWIFLFKFNFLTEVWLSIKGLKSHKNTITKLHETWRFLTIKVTWRNHLDALKRRPNRKYLPHWLTDWWINISKSKQKKEEEEEEYSTWVSMPTRVYWGTSRRRSVTPWFTSSNAVFGSILWERKNFKLLFLFYFENFVVFLFCSVFVVWDTSRRLSRARDAHREN